MWSFSIPFIGLALGGRACARLAEALGLAGAPSTISTAMSAIAGTHAVHHARLYGLAHDFTQALCQFGAYCTGR